MRHSPHSSQNDHPTTPINQKHQPKTPTKMKTIEHWEIYTGRAMIVTKKAKDVASVHCSNKDWRKNLSLIAAAPELLMALQALADAYVENCQLETGKDGEKCDEVIAARLTIKKALNEY